MTTARDLIILTTSPAGLGHIRVMEALRQGLPQAVSVEVLGIQDPRMQHLHRLSSINPYLSSLTEFIQNNPVAEGGFTRWYRQVLRQNPQDITDELRAIVTKRSAMPSRLLIVCTHFGAAHQVASVKNALSQEFAIPVVLAVVVTDDTAQHLWAVSGADYLFVPSESTRAGLEMWFKGMRLEERPEIVVVPYPVSPKLSVTLNNEEYAERQRQTKQLAHHPLTVMVPVSGAAVHLSFYQQALESLGLLTPFQAIVVARENAATKRFLEWCNEISHITVYSDAEDHRVVQLYEEAFNKHVITAEITKPSEQAFKALFTPRQRGGVILLLADPVGRQEDDNLLFLNRHQLIPNGRAELELSEMPLNRTLSEQAKSWRGLMLPTDGRLAGIAIYRWLTSGVFRSMVDFKGFMPGHHELSDKGVEEIWKKLLR